MTRPARTTTPSLGPPARLLRLGVTLAMALALMVGVQPTARAHAAGDDAPGRAGPVYRRGNERPSMPAAPSPATIQPGRGSVPANPAVWA